MPSPRTIFITGANRGIGFELVKQLINIPDRPEIIFAGFRSRENSNDLLTLAKSEPHIRPIQLDVNDQTSHSQVVDEVSTTVGNRGLNLLINNAAISPRAQGLWATSCEQLLESYKTNAVAPLLLTRAFVPLLRVASKSNHGNEYTWSRSAVVNISTILASITGGTPGMTFGGLYPYRMSKVALNMATKCLSHDLKDDKILVVAIHPGWVKTDMGGPRADLSKEESVSAIIKTLRGLNEASNGSYVSYNGTALPY